MNAWTRKALLALLMLSGLPAQQKSRPSNLVDGLVTTDAVDRETARRRLAVAEPFPTEQLLGLLRHVDRHVDRDVDRHVDRDVVLAAVTLLRDRGVARAKLGAMATHEDERVRLAVLPFAAVGVLLQFLGGESATLRPAALFELEDRGLLTDAKLVAALRSEHEDVAEAACRISVLERTPFPIAIAEQIRAQRPRRRLLEWLASRPRSGTGPWLTRILAGDVLTPIEWLLAICSLPPARIDTKLAKLVLENPE